MTITAKASITANILIVLDEDEARSLMDLAAFNGSSIVKALEPVSPAWVRDYGQGFAKLMDRIRATMPQELDRINNARRAFRGEV